jgi:CMP-N-acetylneuraminate monooxygenase
MSYKYGHYLVDKVHVHERQIQKSLLPDVINEFDDIFVAKYNGLYNAYNRICDHNGGQLKLDSNGRTATCSLHKWTFNFSDGSYENGCKKFPLKIVDFGEYLTIIEDKKVFPQIQTEELVDSVINFFFNAHASVSIEVDGLNLITDPWLIGSCFVNGWWHAFPPSDEAISRLQEANFIYISHNHPDHLHMPTLEKFVSKDTQILCPNFQSKSVESVLRLHGYDNLVICDFMREVILSTANGDIKIVLMKSGDHRDDSALMLSTKNNKVFLAVDANMPNEWVLPDVDVLFTPFAGGASGFPSRIENFSKSRKIEIIANNRSSMLNNHVKKLVDSTNPKYVVPYAGYFCEINRDSDVNEINKKNSADDLIDFLKYQFPRVIGINPIDHPIFSLDSNGLILKNSYENPSYFLDDDYIHDILNENFLVSKFLDQIELKLVGSSFLASDFIDNLTIVIMPMDDLIKESIGLSLIVDFSEKNRNYALVNFEGKSDIEIVADFRKTTDNNVEILKVRAESFAIAMRLGLPLEDLSIGFQVKMFRDPNIYNFKFWDHFTNKFFVSLNS